MRERTRVGADSVVGRATTVDNDVVIGERVRLQSNVYITAFSDDRATTSSSDRAR